MMTIDDVQYYNMDEITSGLDTGDIYFTKTGSGKGELTFVLTVPETKHCYLYVNSSSFDSISISKGPQRALPRIPTSRISTISAF